MLKYLLIVLMATGAFASNYKLDKEHSNIGFVVKHFSISQIRGQFDDYEATIEFDESTKALIAANVSIKSSSINTQNSQRDNHLRDDSMLGSKKYPELKFSLSGFEATGEGTGKVKGELEIKGVSREVELNYSFGGLAKNRAGVDIVGFSLNGEIERASFGVNGAPGAVAPTVLLDIQVEAQKQ